jgi:hypothetical protein
MTQLSPTPIKDALQSTSAIEAIQVQGWLRTRRDSKDFSFIELNDGSSLRNLQIIAKNTLPNYAALQRLTTGASITVTGGRDPFKGCPILMFYRCCPLVFDCQNFRAHGFELGFAFWRSQASTGNQHSRDKYPRYTLSHIEHFHIATPYLPCLGAPGMIFLTSTPPHVRTRCVH